MLAFRRPQILTNGAIFIKSQLTIDIKPHLGSIQNADPVSSHQDVAQEGLDDECATRARPGPGTHLRCQ